MLQFDRNYVKNFVLFNIIIIITSLLTASFRGALFHYAYIPAGYSVIFLLSHTIFAVYQNKKLFGIILAIIVLFTNILHVNPICLSENCDIQSNFLKYVFNELQEHYYDPQELITEYFNKNVPQGGTLTYGGSEAIAIYYFSPMNVTPTGRSDYAIYFNASIDPASKYDLVKEFSYTSLFPQDYYLAGHGEFHSFEFKGKSPFPEDHRFSIQSIKKFRLYKLKNMTRNDNENN
ncbi:hypothetical protein HY484_04450 [Candidatus Woesearchaeota archaeon]|nr:hypothetical protein [Candidatus Woesearchaeota archaeon]